MNNLTILSKYLNNIGLSDEAYQIFKLAQAEPEIQSWQEVITIAQTPVSDQILTAIQYVAQGANSMYQSAQNLNRLSEADLKLLVEIVSKSNSTDASNFDSLTKTAQINIVKNFGTKALRLMPVIGFMFSFLIALKNFVYGLTTFAKLVKDCTQVDLTWLEVLFPEKLMEKTTQYQDDSEKLKVLAQLTKYSKEFSDEAISFVANIIDFIKDIIFLFLDVGSFGWLTVGDISLSLVLMGIEYVVEANTLPQFDPILTKIIEIANNQIQTLSSEFDPSFFASKNEQEDLYSLFRESIPTP